MSRFLPPPPSWNHEILERNVGISRRTASTLADYCARFWPEAPATGETWGRISGRWERVVAIAGDTMEGPLLVIEPQFPYSAVPKNYLDERVAELNERIALIEARVTWDGGTY